MTNSGCKFWYDCFPTADYCAVTNLLPGEDEAVRIMVASHCHSVMKVMVQYLMSDTLKVMTALILVVFILVWPIDIAVTLIIMEFCLQSYRYVQCMTLTCTHAGS